MEQGPGQESCDERKGERKKGKKREQGKTTTRQGGRGGTMVGERIGDADGLVLEPFLSLP